MDLSFYKDKKVLITGHTGFKGSWMCQILISAGAEVTGYALEAPIVSNLFLLCKLEEKINSIIGDIRNLTYLQEVFAKVQPEIVIHMAAQPLVRESYQNPVYTYDVNVMGTVNILECVRNSKSVKSFLNITTDKVYLNKEWLWGYRENEELNGYDPYSNSKSCSELVTDSYRNSFFKDSHTAISTVRAGNVIGGGDFAANRIIPDCIRAVLEQKEIIVRNPYSVRPYQHVLEPILVYLMIAKEQYENVTLAGCYNVGPDECDCLTTGELVTLFCEKWNKTVTERAACSWKNVHDGGPHEANFLKLDCTRLRSTFHWKPRWHIDITMQKIIDWYQIYLNGEDVITCMDQQISEFLEW